MSQLPDVDHRQLPMLLVTRAGGTRNANLPQRASQPVLEMTAVSADGLVEAEELYEAALDAIYAAVRTQTVVEGLGHLTSFSQAQGAIQTPSEIPDARTVKGSIRLGIRSRLNA